MLSVSPSTQETRLATPPRKIERWKGDAIVARVQSVHSFLFLFFLPPTFPPLSECESGSNVDPRDASSPSPPSFKCAFFLFSFTSTKQKTETAVSSLPPLSMKSVALSMSRIIVEKSFFREPASSRRIK